MPVTARLSKAFYDRLGEEIANELVEWFNLVDATYRSDLREINELNYARFDATVGHRIARSEARLEQRIAQMDTKIDRVTAELRADFAAGLHAIEATLHRELREQTRFMIGVMTALWAALLIPIVGIWFR